MPKGYQKSQSASPVIYLLHGGRGLFNDWFTKTDYKSLLLKLADLYQVLIVTPESESRGYYLDSPLLPASQSETYFCKELIPAIDRAYRTIASERGRAVTSMSIGGHGALYLATRHPKLFCAAGSMSGVTDLNTDTWNSPAEAIEDVNANFRHLLGPRNANQEAYQGYSVVHMTDKMKRNNLKLIIDCGTEDLLIEPNRELHRRLVYNKTPHDYSERPGRHTWQYWENSLPYHLLFFQKVWQANGCLPSTETSAKKE
jgi:putative tributyrin esterase